jgi:hypothetical protein
MTADCRVNDLPGYQTMFRERDYIEPCPHGTYNDGTFATDLMCHPCPAGSSCIRKNAAIGCGPTEYSLEGEIHCHQCPAGAECPNRTSYTLCTAGETSAYGDVVCTDCAVGYMCPDIFQETQPCPPGTYQDAQSQISCKPCALGSYADSYGNNGCTACPAGSYCPYADLTPIVCPYGTFSGGSATTCSRCTDGFICGAGETTANPTACADGFVCNPGRELKGKNTNMPCPAGYFSSAAGEESRLTACTECTAGNYCPAGSATETTCMGGHY